MPFSISLLDPYFELTPAQLQDLLRDLPKSYGHAQPPQAQDPFAPAGTMPEQGSLDDMMMPEPGMLAPQFGGARLAGTLERKRFDARPDPRAEPRRGVLAPQFGGMRGQPNDRPERPDRPLRTDRFERSDRMERRHNGMGVLAPQFGGGRMTTMDLPPSAAEPTAMPDAAAGSSELTANPEKPRVVRRVLKSRKPVDPAKADLLPASSAQVTTPPTDA